MTIVETLGKFTADTAFADLPANVVEETKRILLDSIGCALAALDDDKGKIGIDMGMRMGGSSAEAVVLGTGRRTSVMGAAFANAELINALDMDAVLPPGHVAPYVIPAALALAELNRGSGADLLTALAIAHEMSWRVGKSMDYLRDVKDGVVTPPRVFGYSSTLFGATAAVLKVGGAEAATISHGIGIAAYCMPVNAQMAWVMHAPASTVKYGPTGPLVQMALNSAMYAEGGHRGDLDVLDDAEYGFPAMIGTKRWATETITDQLGEAWRFPTQSTFKPYPYCRVLHTAFDVMGRMQDEHDLRPDEIERIHVQGEGMLEKPIWENTTIERAVDAQFSIKHGIALAAHRVKPGKAWQDPSLVYSDSVMGLMERTSHEAHPEAGTAMLKHPSSRPTRVEIHARGTVFTGEQLFPKGSPSPDPASHMTNDELVAKFLHNGADVLTPAALDEAADRIMTLESQADVAKVMAVFVDGMQKRAAA